MTVCLTLRALGLLRRLVRAHERQADAMEGLQVSLGGIWSLMELEAPAVEIPEEEAASPEPKRKHAKMVDVHVATTEERNQAWAESHPPY